MAKFQPGNSAAVKSGARSPRTVEERGLDVREELTKILSEHLSLSPSDQPLLDAAVDVTTKIRLINEYLDRVSGGSLINPRGKVYAVAPIYGQLMRLAITIYDRLGVGPAAKAQILGNLGPTVSLARQLASRRTATAALEAHQE